MSETTQSTYQTRYQYFRGIGASRTRTDGVRGKKDFFFQIDDDSVAKLFDILCFWPNRPCSSSLIEPSFVNRQLAFLAICRGFLCARKNVALLGIPRRQHSWQVFFPCCVFPATFENRWMVWRELAVKQTLLSRGHLIGNISKLHYTHVIRFSDLNDLWVIKI